VLRDIINDNRGDFPRSGSMIPNQKPSTVTPVGSGKVTTPDVGPSHRPMSEQAGSGWTTPPSVDSWRAPGIDHIDALCDAEDRRFRAERIRELAGAEHAKRLAAAAREAEDKAHEEELKKGKGSK
jgi:hypothetical protein